MERDTNKHHIWFERKNYYTPTDKTLRNLGGFVLNIYAPAHRLLHAQMKPMVKPTQYMKDDIIDLARSIQSEAETRFDVLDGISDFLINKPYGEYERDIRAARIGHHLLQQRQYFNLHPLAEDL